MLPSLQKATSCMARSLTLACPSTGRSRRSTEVKSFPYIFRASSRPKGIVGTVPSVCSSALLSPACCGLTSPWLVWLVWLAKMTRRVLRVNALRTQSGVDHTRSVRPFTPTPFTHAPPIILLGRLEPQGPGSPSSHSYRSSAPTNSTSEIDPSLGNHALTALLRKRLTWKVMTEGYYQYIVPACPHFTHIISVRQPGGPHQSTWPFQNAISKPLPLRSCIHVSTITMPDQPFRKQMATHSIWMPPSPHHDPPTKSPLGRSRTFGAPCCRPPGPSSPSCACKRSDSLCCCR